MSMRRFIAGAVCPQCRAVDRIVVEAAERDEDPPRRRCVSCGFSDTLPLANPAEPVTRLSRRRSPAADAAPVRILDPSRDRC